MTEIRPIAHEDLAAVEEHLPFGLEGKHRERLMRQERGEAVYLVAFEGDRPVGHVLLKWGGCAEAAVASRRPPCPDLEDVLVHPDHRSRGIGAALIAAAERRARGAGHRRIGLSVGVVNDRARALYERLGYVDSGLGEFVERGPTWEETCVYVVRELA